MRPLGVVTGLAFEAQILRRGWVAGAPGLAMPMIEVAPGRAAAAAARNLLDRGAELLLSFGVAGGLDAAMAPGALVIADHVVDEAGCRTELGGDARLRQLTGSVSGALLTTREMLPDSAAKRRVTSTGALAVDMETAWIAAVAAARGRSVIAIRAIADPLDRQLPRLALDATDERGRLQPGRIAWCLVTRPRDWPAVIAVARDTARARRRLRDAAARLALLAGQGLL